MTNSTMPWYDRPLKDAGSKAIEEAISKALSDLAGKEYKASISNIDFEASDRSAVTDTIKITFTVCKARVETTVEPKV